MRLPPGATGFTPSRAGKKPFTAACHQADRALGDTVGLPGLTPNYAIHTFTRRRTSVWRHGVLPWLAFARDDHFVDDPELAAALGDGWRFLTVAELDTDLSRADLSALHEDELAQVRYWQPLTVGDLLFHDWD